MSDLDPARHARTLTVSAAYGAGGSVVAPALAERLGLAFYDRLLREPDSDEQIIERLSEEEQREELPSRRVASLGNLSAAMGFPIPNAADLDPSDVMRRRIEVSVLGIAQGGGGVILGRGAVAVLAGDPAAFHVRLDGPVEARVRQGMAIEGIDERTAREHQAAADRTWAKFGQRVFRREFTDARLYHLVLDTTALALDDAVALIAQAALLSWAHRLDG
jgi:cytidylate kinase